MKKITVFIAAVFALSAPLMASAADQGSMPMNHGSMPMNQDSMPMNHGSADMNHGNMNNSHNGMMTMGKMVHEEVVNGVKATFRVIDIHKKMKEMGMAETHHIMVMFTDAKTGKQMNGGEAKIKIMGPDKSDQVKNLMGMEGGFGSDFTMQKKGKYGVMCKAKLSDGKVRTVKFWYTVK